MIRTLIPALLGSAAVFAQAPPARLEFEVASVKPSASTPNQVNIGVHIDGAQVHYTYFSLQDYIRIAYKVKNFQISGPEWLATQHYDIDAKLPAGATRDQTLEMLQSLLADRFEVKLHRDSKDFNVYALLVAKGGIKATEVPVEPGDDKPLEVKVTGSAKGAFGDYGNGAYFGFTDNKFEVKKLGMASVADMLARFLDQPVLDMTELKGKYNFTLNLSEEDYRVMMIRAAVSSGYQLPPQALALLEGATDQSLYAALRAEGLSLEKRKAPLEVLVIDHALKTPTEN